MTKELKKCLVCNYGSLEQYCDLGKQPLVNNLMKTPGDVEKYPLVVNHCPMCTNKQLSLAVDPDLLFKDYLYQTGISESHKKYFEEFAQELTKESYWGSILDIGCNDAIMLKYFKNRGWDVLGIDPGENFPFTNVMVIKDFFPSEKLNLKTFDVITAFNVFAHNDNPKKVLDFNKFL